METNKEGKRAWTNLHWVWCGKVWEVRWHFCVGSPFDFSTVLHEYMCDRGEFAHTHSTFMLGTQNVTPIRNNVLGCCQVTMMKLTSRRWCSVAYLMICHVLTCKERKIVHQKQTSYEQWQLQAHPRLRKLFFRVWLWQYGCITLRGKQRPSVPENIFAHGKSIWTVIQTGSGGNLIFHFQSEVGQRSW